MKKNILSLLGVILLTSACNDEKPTPATLNSFPMNVGTEWIYNMEDVAKAYESETSDSIIHIDTVNSSYRVAILKDTVLRDSISVKKFVANEMSSTLYSKEYFKLDKDGLKGYAFEDAGPLVFAKKKSIESVKNKMILPFRLDPLTNTESSNGPLYFYDKPILTLKFPLLMNDKWTYVYPSEHSALQIDKEVIGYERLKTEAGTFDCYKIKNNYLNVSYFEGFEWVDWISSQGLIQRQTINNRVTYTTSNGDTLGNFQLIETLTLKELMIK